MSGLYLHYPPQKNSICLTNENIHYDVDENLWPNPQDRVDKNIKCSEEHSVDILLYRPNVVCSYLISSCLKFYEKPVGFIISSIIIKKMFNDSSVCTFLSSLLT